MVVIDTPGHQHFKNLRSCDLDFAVSVRASIMISVRHQSPNEIAACASIAKDKQVIGASNNVKVMKAIGASVKVSGAKETMDAKKTKAKVSKQLSGVARRAYLVEQLLHELQHGEVPRYETWSFVALAQRIDDIDGMIVLIRELTGCC